MGFWPRKRNKSQPVVKKSPEDLKINNLEKSRADASLKTDTLSSSKINLKAVDANEKGTIAEPPVENRNQNNTDDILVDANQLPTESLAGENHFNLLKPVIELEEGNIPETDSVDSFAIQKTNEDIPVIELQKAISKFDSVDSVSMQKTSEDIPVIEIQEAIFRFDSVDSVAIQKTNEDIPVIELQEGNILETDSVDSVSIQKASDDVSVVELQEEVIPETDLIGTLALQKDNSDKKTPVVKVEMNTSKVASHRSTDHLSSRNPIEKKESLLLKTLVPVKPDSTIRNKHLETLRARKAKRSEINHLDALNFYKIEEQATADAINRIMDDALAARSRIEAQYRRNEDDNDRYKLATRYKKFSSLPKTKFTLFQELSRVRQDLKTLQEDHHLMKTALRSKNDNLQSRFQDLEAQMKAEDTEKL